MQTYPKAYALIMATKSGSKIIGSRGLNLNMQLFFSHFAIINSPVLICHTKTHKKSTETCGLKIEKVKRLNNYDCFWKALHLVFCFLNSYFLSDSTFVARFYMAHPFFYLAFIQYLLEITAWKTSLSKVFQVVLPFVKTCFVPKETLSHLSEGGRKQIARLN